MLLGHQSQSFESGGRRTSLARRRCQTTSFRPSLARWLERDPTAVRETKSPRPTNEGLKKEPTWSEPRLELRDVRQREPKAKTQTHKDTKRSQVSFVSS